METTVAALVAEYWNPAEPQLNREFKYNQIKIIMLLRCSCMHHKTQTLHGNQVAMYTHLKKRCMIKRHCTRHDADTLILPDSTDIRSTRGMTEARTYLSCGSPKCLTELHHHRHCDTQRQHVHHHRAVHHRYRTENSQ